MRWIWIDRFLEFESGSRAKAVKNVTLAEEHLHDHFPGFPVMPGSLMIEGMAQTGGILLGEMNGFEHIVILAKVPRCVFHGWVQPGDTLVYEATLLDARAEGGTVSCTAHACTPGAGPSGEGGRLVAEAEILFAHVDPQSEEVRGIDQKNFVFNSGLMQVFQVGKVGTGAAA